MTERERGALRPLPFASPPTPPRDFTPAELAERAEAMQRLAARRSAQTAEAIQQIEVEQVKQENARAFRTMRRSPAPPVLLPSVPDGFQLSVTPSGSLQEGHRGTQRARSPRHHFETPSRLSGAATVPASLEAAMEHVRRPQPGTPAARAIEAVERARPIIETHVKRRDARQVLLTVLRAMYQAAYTLIEAQGQSEHATLTFFTVLDLLPLVTHLSSDQCERATRRLQELGLIHKTSGARPTGRTYRVKDQQGHERERKTYRGGTWTTSTFLQADTGEKLEIPVCAGTWVAVLLRPAPGLCARVLPHELPACPRDLTADRRAGHTAWQMLKEVSNQGLSKVRESLALTGTQFDISPLLRWALPKNTASMPVVDVDTRTSALSLAAATTAQEVVWNLDTILAEHPQRRREAIQEAGQALARIFRDSHSLRHYYRVLWRATDAHFRGLPAYSQLQHAMQRTLTAMTEVQVTRPGAWLTRLLKDCSWWEAVYRCDEAAAYTAA